MLRDDGASSQAFLLLKKQVVGLFLPVSLFGQGPYKNRLTKNFIVN